MYQASRCELLYIGLQKGKFSRPRDRFDLSEFSTGPIKIHFFIIIVKGEKKKYPIYFQPLPVCHTYYDPFVSLGKTGGGTRHTVFRPIPLRGKRRVTTIDQLMMCKLVWEREHNLDSTNYSIATPQKFPIFAPSRFLLLSSDPLFIESRMVDRFHTRVPGGVSRKAPVTV